MCYEMYAARMLLEKLGVEPSPVSVWARQAEVRTQHWAVAFELTRSEVAQARFRKTAPGALSGRVYASAIAQDRLEVATAWIGWLFLIDDQLDESAIGRDPLLVRERLRPFAAMATEMTRAKAATPEGETSKDSCQPLLAALRDIWVRVAPTMPMRWRVAFSRNYSSYLSGCEWEANNRALGRIPSIREFRQKRRQAGAIWPSLDLLEYVSDTSLPNSLRGNPLLAEIRTACADVVCWSDDLLTVTKERLHGDVHNFAIVLEHALGCDEHRALDLVTRHIESRMADFEVLRETILAMRVDAHAEKVIRRHVEGLHHWMRGHLEWGLQTIRYDAQALSTAYLEDLFGMGE